MEYVAGNKNSRNLGVVIKSSKKKCCEKENGNVVAVVKQRVEIFH